MQNGQNSVPASTQTQQPVPTQAPQHLIWPVETHPISGEFNSTAGRGHAHRGIDIGVRLVEVKATTAGVVISTGYSRSRCNYIYINHGGGTQSVYEHLEEMRVAQGNTVTQGQIIAISGNSGTQADGRPYPYHLHFELLLNVPDSLTETRVGKEPPFDWPAGTTGYHVNPSDYLGK
jgi:murein DD-endopeptidase MepM/ murein hydrolase activator NlpD